MSAAAEMLTPVDAKELIEIVLAATVERRPLQIVGGDTKKGMGLPARQTQRISTARFDRIIDYDPSELVLTTGAGVKLSNIQALLTSHDQMLAFDPHSIVGSAHEAATIGGVVAAGFAGPRRVSGGNVRDHLLGFTAISGRAEEFVAGGRVVKNVTGYDLSKLMCGSWGQLAILTQLTLKVLPRPRASLTLDTLDLEDHAAYTVMTQALRSQADVAAAAYIPAGLTDARSHTLLRLEGFGPSVDARARLLRDLFAENALDTLNEQQAQALWCSIGSMAVLSGEGGECWWRICVPSTKGAEVCSKLRSMAARLYADWGGGLILARVESNVAASTIRSLAESASGHATLLRAPDAYRLHVPALHPEPSGVAALTQRVKASFDPSGILDPDRFAPSAA